MGPQRRSYGATGEDRPILGMVADGDALAGSGEGHAVVAHHRAATQGGEADIAGPARAGMAVPGGNARLGEVDAAPHRGRLPEEEGRAGGRIHFHAVMHLDDFDVEILAQSRSDLPHETGEQVHAEGTCCPSARSGHGALPQ